MEEKKPFGYIYLLVDYSTEKRKCYVGQTTRPVKVRFNEHCRRRDTYIEKAINAHGKENFSYHILKECYSQEELDLWECLLIILLNTKRPFGYNIADGGEGASGWHPTPEQTAENAAKIRKETPYKNLLAEMIAHGITTYTALAILLGLSNSTVAYKMRGKVRFTDKDKAKLVEIFNKPIEYLLERDDGIILPSSNNGENNPFFNKHHTKTSRAKMSKAKRKSPYQNLLKELDEQGFDTYGDFAEPMEISAHDLSRKIRGTRNFTVEDKAKIVKLLNKPAEYLFARTDGKKLVSQKARKKSPLQNLIAKIKEKGYDTYAAFAVPMEMNPGTLNAKIGGKLNFTPEQQTKLVMLLDAPIEYLLARNDG